MLGGMTICECITYIFTCGKSIEVPAEDKDEYVYKYYISEDMQRIENERQEAALNNLD